MMPSGSKVGLSRGRELLVYAVILVITSGSLFDIITHREHWPFSRYPMFSWVKRDYSYTEYKLFGVIKDNLHSEINLLEPQYIQPLTILDLSRTFKKNPDDLTYEKYIEAVLKRILERYELLRLAGDHHGPQLRGMSLYKYYWRLDPKGGHVEKPYYRELIFEITNPE